MPTETAQENGSSIKNNKGDSSIAKSASRRSMRKSKTETNMSSKDAKSNVKKMLSEKVKGVTATKSSSKKTRGAQVNEKEYDIASDSDDIQEIPFSKEESAIQIIGKRAFRKRKFLPSAGPRGMSRKATSTKVSYKEVDEGNDDVMLIESDDSNTEVTDKKSTRKAVGKVTAKVLEGNEESQSKIESKVKSASKRKRISRSAVRNQSDGKKELVELSDSDHDDGKEKRTEKIRIRKVKGDNDDGDRYQVESEVSETDKHESKKPSESSKTKRERSEKSKSGNPNSDSQRSTRKTSKKNTDGNEEVVELSDSEPENPQKESKRSKNKKNKKEAVNSEEINVEIDNDKDITEVKATHPDESEEPATVKNSNRVKKSRKK